jgi:hypothetical protein
VKAVLLGLVLGCVMAAGVFAAHCLIGDAHSRASCEADGGRWSHAIDWRRGELLHLCEFYRTDSSI